MEECLREWPEAVVPVQALSESGVSAVPDRYVKPLSDRPARGLCLIPAGREPNIPVVDLGGLSGGAVACRAAIQAVAAACRDWGFFQVVNHGISPDVIGPVRAAWRGFFDRPTEEKRRYANSPSTYEGYGSRVGVEKGAVLDWGDYYFLNLLPAKIKSQDKRWPENPAACKAATEEYGREATKLCGVLMKAMSIGLGLDAEFLRRAFGGEGEAGACLRVNYYPKCPQPELTLGLSAHSDPGGLTVLLADERVAGLQVRKGDSWVTVKPLPGALIVNVGDQIQVLSNATYKSVEHRVVANAAAERLSLAFFYNPRSDVPLGPARELVTPDRPPLYQPMTFGEYRLYIRKNGPRGKAQLESLARGQVTN